MVNATEWYDLDTLELWSDNPNEGDIGAIMMSIKEFGFNDTGAYWEGIVKGGNHSVMALQQLRRTGWSPADCKIESKCLLVAGDNWKIALIDVSHMDEITSDAFGVALNRTQRLGYDNQVKMAELLQRINNNRGTLQGTAYDADDLDYMLQTIANQSENENSENTSPIGSDIVGDDGTAYLIYIAFKDQDDFKKGLELLSYGDRHGNTGGMKMASLDGSDLLEKWEQSFVE